MSKLSAQQWSCFFIIEMKLFAMFFITIYRFFSLSSPYFFSNHSLASLFSPSLSHLISFIYRERNINYTWKQSSSIDTRRKKKKLRQFKYRRQRWFQVHFAKLERVYNVLLTPSCRLRYLSTDDTSLLRDLLISKRKSKKNKKIFIVKKRFYFFSIK